MNKMGRSGFSNYCDKDMPGKSDTYFFMKARGQAFFCGTAYPTEESRSDSPCRKALEVGGGSFLRRPSLRDEAVNTIADFINQGIYAFQEPGKPFFCSLAALYEYRGKARTIVSGDAHICHFKDGKLIGQSEEQEEPLFGERIRREQETEPEFELSGGSHAFLLVSGLKSNEYLKIIEMLQAEQDTVSYEEDVWPDAIIEKFEGKACSVAAFVMPERKGKVFQVFGI